MGKCLGYHLISESQFCQKSGHSTFVLSTINITIVIAQTENLNSNSFSNNLCISKLDVLRERKLHQDRCTVTKQWCPLVNENTSYQATSRNLKGSGKAIVS